MNNVSFLDRIISVLTYYTFGAVGVFCMILYALLRKSASKFATYHILQSIFLSIILYLITLLMEIAVGFTINLPFVGGFIKKIVIYASQTPIYLGFSLIHYIIFIIISYLAIFALFGKHSYLPYISEMVKSNLGDRWKKV